MIINNKKTKITFGSKADTLDQLRNFPLTCEIPAFIYFSYEQWNKQPDHILNNISEKLLTSKVAVRSSAVCEDGLVNSNAGAFESVLSVDRQDHNQIKAACEKVLASYPEKNPGDQVLIQQMVENITVSGVILTRFVDDGSPYYVLNYDDETGVSDSVTAGTGVHKTVMVYRKFKPEYCDSDRVRTMLALAREVEQTCGQIPLDIEFAMDHNNKIYLLQVRRISTVGGWHPDTEHRVSRVIPQLETFIEQLSERKEGLYGDYTILGNMPDWNPAELIGAIPSPLAASLFRRLITASAWHQARTKMGYRRLPQTELMVLVNGRPFIDVRASFNSFLPEGLPPELGDKTVNAWLDRLADNPSLHDKVEFEVAHTIVDFSSTEAIKNRYSGHYTTDELETILQHYRVLTNKALDLSKDGTLPQALAQIDYLAGRQKEAEVNYQFNSPLAIAAYCTELLSECLHQGTIPFSVIARHAFIAETLLRSALIRGAISPGRLTAFKTSFSTIMGELSSDTLAVCEGRLSEEAFHQRYGHLRPGTFDIMSPRYSDRPDLFENCQLKQSEQSPLPFKLKNQEKNEIEALLKEAGLTSVNAEQLFDYARQAICGREYAKFIFTRNLSTAIELIAAWGESYNLGREDLSYLRIEDIEETGYASSRAETTSGLMQKVDRARLDLAYAGVLKLSYLIRGVKDLHVVPIHRSEPNFITTKRIEKPLKFLQASALNYGNISDSLVCIENADPGFDWIFTKGIAGLVTKYGGANSHMAIRCAELQLPAAIGCGEDLFERIKGCRKLELDCAAKIIRPL